LVILGLSVAWNPANLLETQNKSGLPSPKSFQSTLFSFLRRNVRMYH
jgi:hypothetical protein